MPTPRDFMKHGLTQCQHGQLARQCLLCEQAAEIEWQRCKIEWMRAEIEQLRTETKALRQALRDIARHTVLDERHRRSCQIAGAGCAAEGVVERLS